MLAFTDKLPTGKRRAPDGAPHGVTVGLIVARARNGVIGRDGDLPWRLRDDLKAFKAATLGKPIIMGRKTWDSLPNRPLPGRTNIVVTRNSQFVAQGALVFGGPAPALAAARASAAAGGASEVWVIGGASLYAASLPHAQRLLVTEVDAAPSGDAYFPEFGTADWREESVRHFPAGEGNDHAFIIRDLRR